VDNPIGIPGVPNPEYGALSGLTSLLVMGFLVGSALSLVIRYLRSRGVERLQIKWFAFAVLNVLVLMIAGDTLRQRLPLPSWFWDALFGLAVLALPLAIGFAVMRYRLYEIDRIISRTVAYTIVIVLLVVAYMAALSALSWLLPTESPLAVAASTLAAAALFNPLRVRVQAWVDRRFNAPATTRNG
jgi:hypothetical protein